MVGPSLLLLTDEADVAQIFQVASTVDARELAFMLYAVGVCVCRSDHPASHEDERSDHGQAKDDAEILPEVFHYSTSAALVWTRLRASGSVEKMLMMGNLRRVSFLDFSS